jgi:hypothetical protein
MGYVVFYTAYFALEAGFGVLAVFYAVLSDRTSTAGAECGKLTVLNAT